jgi:hypothetical protein
MLDDASLPLPKEWREKKVVSFNISIFVSILPTKINVLLCVKMAELSALMKP